jgi:hypothetical protein
MLNNDDPFAINPAADGLAPRGNSGISTASPPNTPQGTKRDFGSEWIERAMQTSTQMHHNEDFRREIARGLF